MSFTSTVFTGNDAVESFRAFNPGIQFDQAFRLTDSGDAMLPRVGFMIRFCILLCFFSLAACGTIPKDQRDEAQPQNPPAETTAKTPGPVKPSPKSSRKPAAPAKNPAPVKLHTLNVYVSNQSFNITPVDIRVYLNGELVVDGLFPVKYQQNWKKYQFELPRGPHNIRVESTGGRAELERKIDLQSTQWAVINYWYQPKENEKTASTSRKFTFEIKGEPFYFDN